MAPRERPSTTQPPLAYSVHETCHLLSLGRTTVFDLMNQGRLRRIKIGMRTLVTAESIKQLLEGEAP
ncbi:helix-turn-helix domain-containing protein [Roseomonas sp. GC11]|uniref:helix-turn-helix domain-containing protein n=1 Tax=Roseomonas sp. GC11 TaxID=2950546 RepID=UPI0021098604|nr:helix-turn-helix domain-containing protein [Roseomonas sp. GC11]MCQ4158800.1 helix-turn-helix domain-containing protein [Roseomonas sp. GC11]